MATPEELARQNIDSLRKQCGWLVQDYKQLDLSAGRGISVEIGLCDYFLLVDREPIGIVEAKKECFTPSSVADCQSSKKSQREHQQNFSSNRLRESDLPEAFV